MATKPNPMSSKDSVPDQAQTPDHGPWFWASMMPLAAFIIIAAAQLTAGALYVVLYAGDNAYVMDVIARITLGQVPHVDFGLHLGALPFFLIAATDTFLPGQPFLVAQCIYVAACLLLGIWIVRTRLGLMSGSVLMLAVVLHGTAITGPTTAEVSMVVFYNRWAWIVAYLFLTAFLIDPRDGFSQRIDGGLIGALAFMLFATKITFFVALVPIALLRYITLHRWSEIVTAAIVFLAFAGAGLLIEPTIWIGYIEDLIWVSDNPIRQAPGMGFFQMLAAPAFTPHTLAFVSCVTLVWLCVGARQALWFVLAGLGLFFVQYQNHANAPFWVVPLAVFAWAVPVQFELSRLMHLVWVLLAMVLTALGARLLYPMTLGTIVNRIAATTDNYQQFLPDSKAMDGVYFNNANFAAEVVETIIADPAIPPFVDETECDNGGFWVGHFLAQSEVMAELPGPAFVTDAMTPQWLAAGQPPLQGAAPWNYGSLRGLENAEFVLVPTCAIKLNYKREILRHLVREDVPLEEYRRTEDATIYRVIRDPQ